MNVLCRLYLKSQLQHRSTSRHSFVFSTVAHEMIRLTEQTHSDRFVALITKHYPTWREARAELNELPLTAEEWGGGIES